mmetsp:Transcript_32531/g.68400  ORF Transcript_32531/g.68400 Transcript_32531/m.68400 type:complete len:92 (+) Transcript_32531:387-662(+)
MHIPRAAMFVGTATSCHGDSTPGSSLHLDPLFQRSKLLLIECDAMLGLSDSALAKKIHRLLQLGQNEEIVNFSPCSTNLTCSKWQIFGRAL